MSDYQPRERKPGTGVLLTNRNKRKADSPDWRGEIRVDRAYAAGEIVKLAAWTKDTAGGALISIKEDNYVRPEGGNANPFPSKRRDDDEDVPF